MYLYDSFGPNPRAMRMFLAEKGIDIQRKDVDLMKGENRKPPYTDRNPGGQLPALELDNGKCIGETVAIWEYLEEKHPNPPLIGSNAEERAEARMWQRRIELKITEILYNGFRFAEGQQLFNGRMRLIPEGAPGMKATVQDNLKWLDGLARGQGVYRGQPLHHRGYHPVRGARFRRRRGPENRSVAEKCERMVQARRCAAERREEPPSRARAS